MIYTSILRMLMVYCRRLAVGRDRVPLYPFRSTSLSLVAALAASLSPHDSLVPFYFLFSFYCA
jgi:hypothetical protein